MSMPSFEYSYLLLLSVPLLWCLFTCKEKIRWQYFVHLQLFTPKKPWLKLEWLLKIITLLALVVGLASPVLFDRANPDRRSGIDIVLSLDGSGSMGASGFDSERRMSRFEAVQEIAKDFILKRTEDNVGVVLFGDFAFIASPLTYEKEIIAEMIGYLSHGMAGQNTAIGEGILMALRALERSKAKERIVILLSDGEQNSGRISPKDAVAMAIESGVKIYTIGIGDERAYDSALLKEIAKESQGQFFAAKNSEELRQVYAQIDSLERSSIKSRAYLIKDYYFYWPLLIAFASLFILFHRGQRL
ncbi:MAG: VWA domain-containing protein [Campylobacterota bacterium]|nr:VWA domain-containing protein [Campylobacterota bacterium]